MEYLPNNRYGAQAKCLLVTATCTTSGLFLNGIDGVDVEDPVSTHEDPVWNLIGRG